MANIAEMGRRRWQNNDQKEKWYGEWTWSRRSGWVWRQQRSPGPKKPSRAQGKEDSPGRTAQPDHDRKVREFMQGIPIIAGKNKAEIAMILAVAAATVPAYYD